MTLKERLESYFEKNRDRFAARYLCKRDSILWNEVVEATSFLVEPMPAQRCWHVRNEFYDRPLCPVTGEFVKWFENRYLTHVSRSAKARNPIVRKKMLDTFQERTGYDGHWRSHPTVNQKATAAVRAGIASGKRKKLVRSENWKRKVVDTWASRINVADATSYKSYRDAVVRLTKVIRRINKDQFLYDAAIDQIDHIFSVHAGWKQGVPIEVISHKTNLRIIPKSENSRKGSRCDKSIIDLYTDFADSEGLSYDEAIHKYPLSVGGESCDIKDQASDSATLPGLVDRV